jgi:hypothetical protein
MKTIPLEDAFKILQDASAIIVEDGVLLYPTLSELAFSDENEFLHLMWGDEDGQGYQLVFNEGMNQEVKISGSSMFLMDVDAESDMDASQITILTTKELEIIRIIGELE